MRLLVAWRGRYLRTSTMPGDMVQASKVSLPEASIEELQHSLGMCCFLPSDVDRECLSALVPVHLLCTMHATGILLPPMLARSSNASVLGHGGLAEASTSPDKIVCDFLDFCYYCEYASVASWLTQSDTSTAHHALPTPAGDALKSWLTNQISLEAGTAGKADTTWICPVPLPHHARCRQ